ncbi:MAG: hypothetical protein WAP03_13660 [Methylorubrum rhodinum]|uniref:hypothetical protein n=1 Tax=Methylorubrum rhodinum TaxID=29428 RepID=UPI003BB0FAE7
MTASGGDKQMDDFVDAISKLVTNAVADGIKAGLEAAGIKTTVSGRHEFTPNGAGFRPPGAPAEPRTSPFKVPAARSDSGFRPPKAVD